MFGAFSREFQLARQQCRAHAMCCSSRTAYHVSRISCSSRSRRYHLRQFLLSNLAPKCRQKSRPVGLRVGHSCRVPNHCGFQDENSWICQMPPCASFQLMILEILLELKYLLSFKLKLFRKCGACSQFCTCWYHSQAGGAFSVGYYRPHPVTFPRLNNFLFPKSHPPQASIFPLLYPCECGLVPRPRLTAVQCHRHNSRGETMQLTFH